jgi:hypothetical protein
VTLAKYECGTVAELRPARKCNLLLGRLCGASTGLAGLTAGECLPDGEYLFPCS